MFQGNDRRLAFGAPRSTDKATPTMRTRWIACFMLTLFFACGAMAEDTAPAAKRGTRSEAVALVKRGINELKTVGADKALAEFNTPKGPFSDRDLYLIVYDSLGTCLAHGFNQNLTGLDEQDPDGVYYIKERMERMKTENAFWQKYRWSDPLTHKILPKVTYCEVVHDVGIRDLIICSGVYDVPE